MTQINYYSNSFKRLLSSIYQSYFRLLKGVQALAISSYHPDDEEDIFKTSLKHENYILYFRAGTG